MQIYILISVIMMNEQTSMHAYSEHDDTAHSRSECPLLLTDQLLNDFFFFFQAWWVKLSPVQTLNALQSAAAFSFQLNSFKCNKTMQEMLESCGPGCSHS